MNRPNRGSRMRSSAAFFAYIDRTFVARRKYVTLFGGEPLLPNERSLRALEGLIAGTLNAISTLRCHQWLSLGALH